MDSQTNIGVNPSTGPLKPSINLSKKLNQIGQNTSRLANNGRNPTAKVTSRTANQSSNVPKKVYEYPHRLINEDLMVLCQEKNNAIEQIKEEMVMRQQDTNVKALDDQNDVSKSDSGAKNPATAKRSHSDLNNNESVKKRSRQNDIQFFLPQTTSVPQLVGSVFGEGAEEQSGGFETVCLVETPTAILYSNPSFFSQTDKPEVFESVAQSQKAYRQTLAGKTGNDNYVDHSVRTYVVTTKHFETQTESKNLKESGAQVDAFDIDSEMTAETKSKQEMEMRDLMAHVQRELEGNVANPFCMLQTDLESILIYSRNSKSEFGDDKKKGQGSKHTQRLNTNTFQRDKVGQGAGNASVSMQMNFQQSQTANENMGKTANQDKKNVLSGLTKSGANQSRPIHNKDSNNSLNNTSEDTMTELNMSIRNFNKQQLLEREIKRFKEELKGPLEHLVLSEHELKAFHNKGFLMSLGLVEKIILQSAKKTHFLTYSNRTSAEDDSKGKASSLKPSFLKRQKNDESEKEQVGSLKSLFTFRSDRFEGQQVNALQYNSFNTDMIAAGYGNTRVVDNCLSNGVLAVWTVKNCNVPLRFYESSAPVTSLSFSKTNPNLLAMGDFQGSLKIFDVRRKAKQPIMCSDDLDELKHLESILEIDWVCKSQGREDQAESLVSISADGKLLEWSMKKTLDVSELKQITQSANPLLNEQNEMHSRNFRYSGGFSFDFNKKDPNIYLIATEDGIIHKCSKSYKEQYLESYFSHTGPIYKVRHNPFHSDVFISCSADWSVRIWNSKSEAPVFVLKSLDLYDEVLDCRWNPFCSTSFASACKDGRVEMWDLALKNLDPIFILKGNGRARTCLEFSATNPTMMVGNDSGEFECFRIFGYENQNLNEQKQQETLERIFSMSYKTQSEASGSHASQPEPLVDTTNA